MAIIARLVDLCRRRPARVQEIHHRLPDLDARVVRLIREHDAARRAYRAAR